MSFIANHTRYKERIFEELISLRPNLNLCIWGDRWNRRCESTALRRCIKGFSLLGERYTRAIQAARINLAIMSGIVMELLGYLTTSGPTLSRLREVLCCTSGIQRCWIYLKKAKK